MSLLTLGYRPVVMVAMPSATGFPYPEVLLNVFNQSCRDEVDIIFSKDCIAERMPVQNARNKLSKMFIKTNATHIWWLDDDNPPSLDTLANLLNADKDMVTALVPLRTVDHLNTFVNWKHKDTFDPSEWEYQKIDNCGTWCLLMKREVLEAVYKETDWVPFQFEFKKFACDLNDVPVEYQWQEKWEDGWEEKYKKDEDGTILLKNQYVSEDLYFWRIAKRLGFELWASIYSTCYHFTGEVWVKRIDRRTVYSNPDS